MKEKRPPPRQELGVSNLFARGPFDSLCGYSLCALFAPDRRVLRRRLVRVSVGTEVLRMVLRTGGVTEGA